MAQYIPMYFGRSSAERRIWHCVAHLSSRSWCCHLRTGLEPFIPHDRAGSDRSKDHINISIRHSGYWVQYIEDPGNVFHRTCLRGLLKQRKVRSEKKHAAVEPISSSVYIYMYIIQPNTTPSHTAPTQNKAQTSSTLGWACMARRYVAQRATHQILRPQNTNTESTSRPKYISEDPALNFSYQGRLRQW